MVNEYGEMWVSDDHEEKFMTEICSTYIFKYYAYKI